MLSRQYIQSSQVVNYPVDKLWELISSCEHVEKWHPLIDYSSMSGSIRKCVTEQGTLIETILVNDGVNKTFKYHIQPQSIYPISSDLICTIKVIDGKEGTLFMWDIEFQAVSESKFTEMKEGFYTLAGIVKSMIESLGKPL